MSTDTNLLVSPEKATAEPLEVDKVLGIWKSEYINGELCFSRNIGLNKAAHLWSAATRIPPKSNRKRLVLLGESVARGYLYDPYFNPAICLETLLNNTGAIEAEVVDLAKVSIEITELTQLTKDCLLLNPDAIIVFAGNNWFSSIRNNSSGDVASGIDKIIADYSLGGEAGSKHFTNDLFMQIKSYIEGKMKELTINYVSCLSEISASKNIPVVFIIPEFNLLDWKSTEAERILFRLTEADMLSWLNAKREAENALEVCDMNLLAAMAAKMIEVDNSHPLGYELLAYYHNEIKEYTQARQCLQKARDTSMLCRSSGQAHFRLPV